MRLEIKKYLLDILEATKDIVEYIRGLETALQSFPSV